MQSSTAVIGSSIDESDTSTSSTTKTATLPSQYVPTNNPRYEPKPSFTRVSYLQPHWKRRKQILSAHPEIEHLSGPDSFSVFYIFLCVGIMTYSAYLLREASWPMIVLATYTIGAVTNHALWVLIHDATHDCMFKSKAMNLFFLCICNLPHIAPSGISFRHYHRIHHSHLNEAYADPDVPGETELKIFCTNPLMKIIWLFLFPIIQIYRTSRYSVSIFGFWICMNWAMNVLFAAAIYQFMGAKSLTYLTVASYFSIGLHPVGARWISEHFSVCPTQETFSYYGPLNLVSFNIGYHNEHHDLPDVPWNKLPTVRKLAPEFYETLYQHNSYLNVLRQFFFDPKFTLHLRIV